jgi:serine/threonine protein kinase
MSHVLAAVAAAHDEGILHRDIKPENIMVLRQRDETDGQERVKVLDFGIAKIGSSEGTMSRALTAVGEICGTPEYMSPEQARGLTLDARTDLYSCGVVLFRILTGKLPFLGENPVGTLMQHITEPVPRPSTLRPDIPPMLDDVIVKAMAKQPADRCPDARTMRSALLDAVGAERNSLIPEIAFASRTFRPSTPSPSIAQLERAPTMSVAPSRSGSWRWAVIVLVLAASVVASMALMRMRMPAPTQVPQQDFTAEDTPNLSTTHFGPSKSGKPQKGTKNTDFSPDETLDDETGPMGKKSKRPKKEKTDIQLPKAVDDLSDIEEILGEDQPVVPEPPVPEEDTDAVVHPPDENEHIFDEEPPVPI